MSTPLVYNQLIAQQRERYNREARHGEWLKANIKRLNAEGKKIEALLARFKASTTDNAFADHVGTSSAPAQYEGDTHIVYFTISARQLQGLKDPRLEILITPFLDSDESSSTDWPTYMNRDYKFTYALDGGKIHVTIAAYVAEENPTCRKILVDRKVTTQVVDVYKLACDGDIIEGELGSIKLADGTVVIEG